MSDNLIPPLKVLHVEDDEDTREIAAIALGLSNEVELLQCASGEEALSKAPDFGPDVILLDVMMPNMSGPEVLKRLKDNPELARVPVIFMTARAQPSEIESLISIGANSVIVKPFEPMELLSKIISGMECPL